jgi:F420-dependent oxidoreductase-like protein
MEMLEAYTTLGYLAGLTRHIRLGTMVTGVTYRYPGLLIKAATTLDVLSGGRAYLGIGAAWFEREHVGLGIPFPPIAERFERLEEVLQIALQMWSGEVKPYMGHYYQLAETICSPPPLQRPHPPILIGGNGEKKTLRLVARYADACNVSPAKGLDVLKYKLDVLREHCAAEGRSYDAIEKTVLTHLRVSCDGSNGTLTPAQAIERLQQWSELGITHVIWGIANMHEARSLELLGSDVIPVISKF